MATIVNTPAAPHDHFGERDSGSTLSLMVGVLMVLIIAALFFFVALPAIRNVAAPTQAPQINVPDKINVNVNPNPGGN